ncbi:MAG: thiamine-phosphate kinase [Bacteroidales bacterium]|jgi:thiamine-monophosphate kinase|nr:thiamine-phosphate kinase [Bacteroidales bacterium]
MTSKENNQHQKTPIEKTGKLNLIEKLLSGQDNPLCDNASSYESTGGSFITSHSLLLEGTDFDLVYNPLKHLGYKAITSVLGPLYASFHKPVSLSVRVGLSARFFTEDVEELWEGIRAGIDEHKIELVALDLLPSLTGLTISLSSLGKQQKEIFVQRNKPSSGDLICISGSPGAAFMGLQVLEREKRAFNGNTGVQPKLDDYKFILKRYLSPELDYTLSETLINNEIIPSDGEFINRGLSDAVKKVCHRNGLGAHIYLDKIPVAAQTFNMAEELEMDAITAALNGGDDMLLLYIVPLKDYEKLCKELPSLDIIGHLTSEGSGAMLVTPDGTPIPLKAQGWSD